MGRQPSAKRARASKEGMGTMMHTPDASAPRDKPAITTGLRKGARQRRSGAAHDAQEQESALPPELLQLIGGAVDGPDLAAASLVCKLWSRSLRGGVTSLSTHMLADAASNAGKARALARALPHLASLHAHFGARCGAPAAAAFFKGVRAMERLRELRVTAWVPYAPQKGAWPLGAFGHLELGGVTSLAVDGAPLSENEMLAVITGASSGRALASLRLSPGAWPHFTQLDPFQAPAWLVPALPGVGFTGAPPMKSPALAALIACKLPGLQHLAFAPDRDGQAELFGELRRMSRLTSLDLLAGAPVEGKPLQALASLTSLQELRLQPQLGAAPEALEEHSLLGLSQIRRLGVRLSRRSAEPLCRDLSALTRRRAPAALVDLELQRCVWSAEAGACVAALTALTRLRLERPECVRPARASGAASRAAMSVDLQPLVALRGMRCFELVAATGSVAGVVQGLGRLWPAWAPTLECVSLADLSVAELDPCATLPALRACGALTSLRLLLREPMAAEVAAVDVGALPARLEQVALRNVVVTACQAARRRMTCLERLSLRQCTAVPPEPDAGPAGSLRRPPASVHWTLPLLQALPALRSVELVSMPWLRDEDFAGIGRLTALTSLLVCASGTMQVTHAALQALGGLSRLRQLRWHVGDVTDLLPDVEAVRSLSSLVALHLPSYLHGQFARWSAYNALPPLCDVHVEMPLP